MNELLNNKEMKLLEMVLDLKITVDICKRIEEENKKVNGKIEKTNKNVAVKDKAY